MVHLKQIKKWVALTTTATFGLGVSIGLSSCDKATTTDTANTQSATLLYNAQIVTMEQSDASAPNAMLVVFLFLPP